MPQLLLLYVRAVQIPCARSSGRLNVFTVATNIRGFSVELASCNVSGAQNFEVAVRLPKILCRLSLAAIAQSV